MGKILPSCYKAAGLVVSLGELLQMFPRLIMNNLHPPHPPVFLLDAPCKFHLRIMKILLALLKQTLHLRNVQLLRRDRPAEHNKFSLTPQQLLLHGSKAHVLIDSRPGYLLHRRIAVPEFLLEVNDGEVEFVHFELSALAEFVGGFGLAAGLMGLLSSDAEFVGIHRLLAKEAVRQLGSCSGLVDKILLEPVDAVVGHVELVHEGFKIDGLDKVSKCEAGLGDEAYLLAGLIANHYSRFRLGRHISLTF